MYQKWVYYTINETLNATFSPFSVYQANLPDDYLPVVNDIQALRRIICAAPVYGVNRIVACHVDG